MKSNFQEVNEIEFEVDEIDGSKGIRAFETKTIHLKTNPTEAAEALKQLNQMIIEIGKLSESAIHFLKLSYPDEVRFFSIPWADPELSTTDDGESGFKEIIFKKLSQTAKFIDHANKTILKINSCIEDSQLQNLRATAILSYVGAKEMLESCIKTIRHEASLVPNQRQVDVLKSETDRIAIGLTAKETKIAELQSKKRSWRRFFPFIFDLEEMRKQILKLQTQCGIEKNILTKNKKTIKEQNLHIQTYQMASGEFKLINNSYNHLLSQLMSLGLIGENNKLMGDIVLPLNNPIFCDNFTIHAIDFPKVANAYSAYVSNLELVKQAASDASTSFSQLSELISNAAGKGV